MAEVFKPWGNERAKSLVNGLWELVLHRPYWQRGWIIQELVCSTDVLVYCGSLTIPFWVLRKLPVILKDAVANLDTLCPGLSEYAYRAACISSIPTLNSDTRENDLLTHLENHRQADCSNPKDQIYALLGISTLANSTHPGLEIDYSLSMTAVYRGAARAIIEETSSLDILCSVGGAGRNAVTGEYRARQPFLPSWAPDWNCYYSKELSILGNIGAMRDRAAGDTPAKAQFVNDDLIVEGLAIAEILDCGVPFEMIVMGSLTQEAKMEVLFQWREKVQMYTLHQSTIFHTGRRMSQGLMDKDQGKTQLKPPSFWERALHRRPLQLGSLKKWRGKAPPVISTPQTKLKTSSPPLVTTPLNGDGESVMDKFYRLLHHIYENEADTGMFSNESTWARLWMMVHGRPQDENIGSSSRAASRGEGDTRRRWWVVRKQEYEPVDPMELSAQEIWDLIRVYWFCAGRRLFFFDDPRAGYTGWADEYRALSEGG